ncbi:MAG: BrnA antitoxin family protein [Pseudomonadota bacterium]
MKPGISKRRATRRQAELDALAALPDAVIDTSDAPEVGDWSDAVRGRFYRPIKQQLTLRLDADLVAWFKADGAAGYQTRINRALREYVGTRRKRGHATRVGKSRGATGR